MSSATGGMEMTKKILVGTISTVLAAVILYFVLDSKKGNHEKKEATIAAWKNFQKDRDVFAGAIQKLTLDANEPGIDADAKMKAILREMDFSISGMTNIKQQSNVDARMLNIVDAMSVFMAEVRDIVSEGFSKAGIIEAKPVSLNEKQQQAIALFREMERSINAAGQGIKDRINTYRDELCNDYGDSFCRKDQ